MKRRMVHAIINHVSLWDYNGKWKRGLESGIMPIPNPYEAIMFKWVNPQDWDKFAKNYRDSLGRLTGGTDRYGADQLRDNRTDTVGSLNEAPPPSRLQLESPSNSSPNCRIDHRQFTFTKVKL